MAETKTVKKTTRRTTTKKTVEMVEATPVEVYEV